MTSTPLFLFLHFDAKMKFGQNLEKMALQVKALRLHSGSLVQIPLSAQPGKGIQLGLGCSNKAPGDIWVEIAETRRLASGE